MKHTKEAEMLAKLYKMAYTLDQKGLYDEAKKIEEVMEEMTRRVGLNKKELVSLADYFDNMGEVELANKFDDILKNAIEVEKLPYLGSNHRSEEEIWKDIDKITMQEDYEKDPELRRQVELLYNELEGSHIDLIENSELNKSNDEDVDLPSFDDYRPVDFEDEREQDDYSDIDTDK